jgi:hypothetical protein
MISQNKKRTKLNLENPIFVFYIDVGNRSMQKTQEIIGYHKDFFSIYSNITVWIVPSDKTEIQCIFDGGFRNRDKELSELIKEINTKIDVLSECGSSEDFKINIRNWRIENILPNENIS